MNLPVTFLYLGGDKCGSTWLWNVLNRHPDVALARAKELFYFDRFYARGPDWYRRQFPENRARAVGEICHDYLYCDEALARIARDVSPDCRFLVFTRDPVDRAVSHYRYLRKIGRTSLPLSEALVAFPQLLENSRFGNHLGRAVQHLGADRISVFDFADLDEDPDAFAASVCSAIGVACPGGLPTREKVLRAQRARNPALVAALRQAGWAVRALGRPDLVDRVKRSAAVSRVLFRPPDTAPFQISDALRDELSAHFAADQRLLRDVRTRCATAQGLAA